VLNCDGSTVKHALQNTKNDCHQWPSDTKFVFGRGPALDSPEGAYSALPDPIVGLRGPTSKGREGKGDGRGGK